MLALVSTLSGLVAVTVPTKKVHLPKWLFILFGVTIFSVYVSDVIDSVFSLFVTGSLRSISLQGFASPHYFDTKYILHFSTVTVFQHLLGDLSLVCTK